MKVKRHTLHTIEPVLFRSLFSRTDLTYFQSCVPHIFEREIRKRKDVMRERILVSLSGSSEGFSAFLHHQQISSLQYSLHISAINIRNRSTKKENSDIYSFENLYKPV